MQDGNEIDGVGTEQNVDGTDGQHNAVNSVCGDPEVSLSTPGVTNEVTGGTGQGNALAGAQLYTPTPSRNTLTQLLN
jgi:hypothetical protein